MKKVVVAVSPFAEPHEFLGVDGEIYRIEPNAVLILPYENAKVLEKHNLGQIIKEYEDPDRTDDYFERLLEPKTIWDEAEEDLEDPIKVWAKFALKVEQSKPNPDPNKVIELKMLAAGLNPYRFHVENQNQHEEKEFSLTVPETSSPKGLSRPNYNTAQPQYSESDIKTDDEINAGKLKTVLETYGLRLVTTLQAYRVSGLNEIDLSGYAILDYGYTRVEPHPEFVKLVRRLGYEEKDVSAKVLFEHYICEKHGDVFKPALDFAKFVTEDGKKRLIVFAGRLHPAKKHSDAKRYSALKLEQFEAIAEAVRKKGVVSYRKFDEVLAEVRQEKRDLALIWLVFTVPDRLSEYLAKDNPKLAEKVVKKAARSTIRRFLRKYLVRHENVPLSGDFKEGGVVNVHLWSSSVPIKPHVHAHVCLWNFVVWNGKYVRFSPYFPKRWMEELREIWKGELMKWLKKHVKDFRGLYIDDERLWCLDQDYEFFNVYLNYTWFREENYGRIVHHLRYNARKAVIDINEFFYSGVKLEEFEKDKVDWLGFLIQYSNRTGNFGFMNRWRVVFNVSRERIEKMLDRLEKEHYEYCPICKRKLEFIGIVNIDEIAKKRRLLVLWWFDRKMNIEVWRDLEIENRMPRAGFEPATYGL